MEDRIRMFFGEDTTDFFSGVKLYENTRVDLFKRYYYSKYLQLLGENAINTENPSCFECRIVITPPFSPAKSYCLKTQPDKMFIVCRVDSLDEEKQLPLKLIERKLLRINKQTIDDLANCIDKYDLWQINNTETAILDGTAVFIEIVKDFKHKVLINEESRMSKFMDSFFKVLKSAKEN